MLATATNNTGFKAKSKHTCICKGQASGKNAGNLLRNSATHRDRGKHSGFIKYYYHKSGLDFKIALANEIR